MWSWKGKTVCVLMIIGVASALIYITQPNDPVYKGKRLSEYLAQFSAHGLSPGGVNMNGGVSTALILPHIELSCSDPLVYEAIHAVGTNALPMLVRMLGSKDTRFQRWVWTTVQENRFLKEHIRIEPPVRGWKRQIAALAGFQELGHFALPAVPKIIPLLEDPDSCNAAVVALLAIRPDREDQILSLTNALRIKETSAAGGFPFLHHSAALLALSAFGAKASGATPLLVNCMTSTNDRVRASAAIALAKIGAPAAKVVPLIVANLPATNPSAIQLRNLTFAAGFSQRIPSAEAEHAVCMNLVALSEYGGQAATALPLLTNLQSYPVVNIQDFAKQVATKIKANAKATAN
jgi:hypothetical protein